jgi:hypothetical protein
MLVNGPANMNIIVVLKSILVPMNIMLVSILRPIFIGRNAILVSILRATLLASIFRAILIALPS